MLAAFMASACADADVSLDVVMALELALVEAANNIVLHGYGSRPDGRIDLSVRIGSETVDLELTDHGPPLDKSVFEPRSVSLDAESGRGMQIIHACVDRLDYRRAEGVNHLILSKRIAPA